MQPNPPRKRPFAQPHRQISPELTESLRMGKVLQSENVSEARELLREIVGTVRLNPDKGHLIAKLERRAARMKAQLAEAAMLPVACSESCSGARFGFRSRAACSTRCLTTVWRPRCSIWQRGRRSFR